MHWHHQGTRTVAAGFAVPYLRPELAKALGATPVSARSSIRDSLSNIGRFTTAPRGSTTSDPVVTEEDSQLEQVPEVEPV